MAELQPNIVFHGRHFVRHLGICSRIYVKLLQLMSGFITHNSVRKRSLYIHKWLSYSQLQSFTAAILSAILKFVIGFVPIIVFHGRHFVRHLEICNRICVELLQLMSGVITHNSVKTKRSIYINK